jgi:hypothetical protein
MCESAFKGPRCRWEDNIEKDLKTLVQKAWIGLDWEREKRQAVNVHSVSNELLDSVKCMGHSVHR